jgi:hypothetical protein
MRIDRNPGPESNRVQKPSETNRSPTDCGPTEMGETPLEAAGNALATPIKKS